VGGGHRWVNIKATDLRSKSDFPVLYQKEEKCPSLHYFRKYM
jgi:hypothetical protein